MCMLATMENEMSLCRQYTAIAREYDLARCLEMGLKQLDSGFSDSSDSTDISLIVKSFKKVEGKSIKKDNLNLDSNKVTFYSVSDMIRDKSIKIADDLLDEESTGTICRIPTDGDRDIKKLDEDLDSLDYCDYQNNQFPKERNPPCGDRSIQTIINSN